MNLFRRAPPPVTGTDLTEIKIALARIDERTAAQANAAEYRHNNIRQVMNGFVPRREIEANDRARAARILSLERFRATVYRLALALAGAVLAGLAALGKLAHLLP